MLRVIKNIRAALFEPVSNALCVSFIESTGKLVRNKEPRV